jgi:mercuric ion transport protein
MSDKIEKITFLSSIGSVIAGFIASLCCIGPLIFVILGLSGAAFFSKLEQYRWLFGTFALSALALGFFFEYRTENECAPDSSCTVNPNSRRINKIILWIAAVLVLVLIFSPNIIGFFIT